MYTSHGHYIDPPVPGEPSPNDHGRNWASCGGPARGNGQGACLQCTQEEIAAARMFATPGAGGSVPAILSSPTPAAPASSSTSPKPLEVSIDAARDWYQRFLELKDAKAKIDEMLDEARTMILGVAKQQYEQLPDRTNFMIDGRPVLQRQVVQQTRVDSTRLKAERPDVHAAYLKTYDQERLNIL